MDPKEEIRTLFEKYGHHHNQGEPVSYLEHALQTAYIAEENGCGREMIIAALLHDIGHLIAHKYPDHTKLRSWVFINHESFGSEHLKKIGLENGIVELVEGHVMAKRWLARDKSYYSKLSECSKLSLIQQYGPYTDDEADEYLKHPRHLEFTQLRLFDDSAKTLGKKTPDLEYYLNMI